MQVISIMVQDVGTQNRRYIGMLNIVPRKKNHMVVLNSFICPFLSHQSTVCSDLGLFSMDQAILPFATAGYLPVYKCKCFGNAWSLLPLAEHLGEGQALSQALSIAGHLLSLRFPINISQGHGVVGPGIV